MRSIMTNYKLSINSYTFKRNLKHNFIRYIVSNVILNSINKILVIRDGRIGDLLMITPAIDWISEKYSHAKLDILLNQYGQFVFEHNPKIHRIILYNRKSSIVEHFKLINILRNNKYDLIIVLEENSHYKILAYLISNKTRIGLSGKLDCLLNLSYKWDKQKHAIINNLNVLDTLFDHSESPSTEMSLYLSKKDIENANNFMKDKKVNPNQLVIFIQVACGPNDKLRPWLPEYIAKLSDLLIENLNALVLLNSGPNEEVVVNQVQSLMKNKPIINFSSINLTAALIKLSDLFLGPDTGTLHIANALKIPIVALFGPTSVEDCGPIGSAERIFVIKKEFECSPCVALIESKNRDECVAQSAANCMLAISVDEVYSKILTVLKK